MPDGVASLRSPIPTRKADEVGTFERLREHLVAAHNYEPDYFEDSAPIPLTLGNLRWLHAPWLKTREYREGCDPI